MIDIDKYIKSSKNLISKAKTLEDLKQLKSKIYSNFDIFNNLKEEIKKPTSNKKEIGEKIKYIINNLDKIFEYKKEELENSFFFDSKENLLIKSLPNDLYIKNKKGNLHPLTKLSNDIHNFFSTLNYHYAEGKEIETEKYNFDILNLPKNHPARKMQDTFFLEKKNYVLRTHSTNVTARELEESKNDEVNSYSIGAVFRNDDNDATHSFQFNQIDIFSVGKNINIANLKWTINNLLKSIFNKNIKSRYRVSYFPFTEPSLEVDIFWNNTWIEILGSGILHNNVIKNCKKDPSRLSGFAAGIGLERLSMLKYNIKDIRNFYINDLNFLKNIK